MTMEQKQKYIDYIRALYDRTIGADLEFYSKLYERIEEALIKEQAKGKRYLNLTSFFEKLYSLNKSDSKELGYLVFGVPTMELQGVPEESLKESGKDSNDEKVLEVLKGINNTHNTSIRLLADNFVITKASIVDMLLKYDISKKKKKNKKPKARKVIAKRKG